MDWALRYVMHTPGLITVLSGMSSPEQMRENVKIFDDDSALTSPQTDALLALGEQKAAAVGVPCTACHYCTSYCPMELEIPDLLHLYNEQLSREKGGFIAPMTVAAMDEDKRPSACIGCGACAAVCPQQIPIPETLAKFAELVE